jgi:sugar lactone lactonase YvrE
VTLVQGDVEVVRHGLIISNGLGWSPGGRVLHHVDAPTRQIADLHLDVDGRIVSTRASARRSPRAPAIPTGWPWTSTVASVSPGWAGGAVWRLAPDGQVDAIVEVAATNVISCAFGGPDLDVLYITTGGPVTCALPTLPNGSSSEAARRPPASDLRDRR